MNYRRISNNLKYDQQGGVDQVHARTSTMINEFFECYSLKWPGFSFVSRTRECPVESRVIAIRVARVHENWGRVLRATRETANELGGGGAYLL